MEGVGGTEAKLDSCRGNHRPLTPALAHQPTLCSRRNASPTIRGRRSADISRSLFIESLGREDGLDRLYAFCATCVPPAVTVRTSSFDDDASNRASRDSKLTISHSQMLSVGLSNPQKPLPLGADESPSHQRPSDSNQPAATNFRSQAGGPDEELRRTPTTLTVQALQAAVFTWG